MEFISILDYANGEVIIHRTDLNILESKYDNDVEKYINELIINHSDFYWMSTKKLIIRHE